jgi:hypothetical protein
MTFQFGTILFRSIVALTVLGTCASALGDPKPTSLEIRRIKHVIDDNGKVWLSVQFTNHGTNAVKVSAISPTKMGPWVNVDKSVEAGGTVKTLMKVDKKEPTAIWLTTSEGMTVFDLPANN